MSTMYAQGSNAIKRVWAIDHCEKIRSVDLNNPLARSPENLVWDGHRITLFAARNEIVAFQLIMETGSERAKSVDVSLDSLALPPD